MLQDEFVEWVTEQVNDRNEELVEKKDLNIEMDHEIYQAFQASTAVSRTF